MSTFNLKFSGTDIQSQARRGVGVVHSCGSIWSSKERLVKPVSAGLKGVGKDGKLREDELTPMVSFLAAGRGL